jgi:phage portal protein BeeE
VGGKGGAMPQQLYRMRPDRTSVVCDKTKWVTGYQFSVAGETLLYEPEEVLHFKTPHPMNDFYGLSTA